MSLNLFQLPYRVPVRSGRRSRSASGERKSRRSSASIGKKEASDRSRANSVKSSASSARKAKRRRSSSSVDRASDNNGDETDPEPWTRVPPDQAVQHMPPEIVEQYRTAGLQFHEPLPKGRFPHSRYEERDPHVRRKNRLTESELQEELGKLGIAPLGNTEGPQGSAQKLTQSIKQNATANVITVIHRCLQQGDYQRASRAFGGLLRLQIGGQPIDLRRDNFWGIGAEILMKRDRPRRPYNSISTEVLEKNSSARRRTRAGRTGDFYFRYDHSDDEKEAREEQESYRKRFEEFREQNDELPTPTPAATEMIKQYYHLLAVQHPPNPRPRSNLPLAEEFYLAMYGVWISHVDSVRRLEERNIRKHFQGRDMPIDDKATTHPWKSPSPDLSFDTVSPDNTDEHELNEALQSARQRQLEAAREIQQHISAKMEERLEYKEHPELLRTRAMIEEWLADLLRPWPEFVRSMETSEAGITSEEQDKAHGLSTTEPFSSPSISEHQTARFEPGAEFGEDSEILNGGLNPEYDDWIERRANHLKQARHYFDLAVEKEKRRETETFERSRR